MLQLCHKLMNQYDLEAVRKSSDDKCSSDGVDGELAFVAGDSCSGYHLKVHCRSWSRTTSCVLETVLELERKRDLIDDSYQDSHQGRKRPVEVYRRYQASLQ